MSDKPLDPVVKASQGGPEGPPFKVSVPSLSPRDPKLPELFKWMAEHQLAVRELADDKAFEYGSTDLRIMASAMVELFPGISPEEGIQAAIAFYGLGKLSRVLSSFKDGRPAPTDSWQDLEVYAMMAQRVQEVGSWP